MSEREPVCFTCGSSVDTSFDNVLSDGRPCEPCRQRAMEAIAPALPHIRREEIEEMGAGEEGERTNRSLHLLRGLGVNTDDDPVRA